MRRGWGGGGGRFRLPSIAVMEGEGVNELD